MMHNQIYESVCRCCKNKISSLVDKRCPDCGWYICSVCGTCSYTCGKLKGKEIDYFEYEKLYNQIIIFKDLSDLSVFKIKVCKSVLTSKAGGSQYIYEYSEELGEHNGIQYISDRSSLGKWLYRKKVGDIYKRYKDGQSHIYELLGYSDI